MSSRREVLIGILGLLQRKTLLKTNNGTLKCLKRHYLTVQSVKNAAVLTEVRARAFALSFVPTPGDLTAQESPPPGICHPRQKKMLMPGGQPKGGGLGAAGIDSCISIICANQIRIQYPGQFALSKLPEEAWNVR